MHTTNLITEKDVAERLGVSVACLRRWRRVGEGPAFAKLGAAVRYAPADIATWIASSTITPGATKAA